MDYSERMVDELVRKVNNKVKQINSKMEIDVVQANADVLNKVLKQIPMAVENSKKEFEVSLNKAVESIQEWVDKRGVALNRKIEHMLDHKIQESVKMATAIPDLIGEGTEYSTFANFFSTFYRKTQSEIKELKLEQVTLLSRLQESESNLKLA